MAEPTKLLSAEEFYEWVVEEGSSAAIAKHYAAALTALREAEQARDAATKRVAELDGALNAANGRTLMVAQGGLQSELEMATKFDKEIGAMYAQVAYALGWDKVEEWSWGSAIGTLTDTRAERDALAAELAELRAIAKEIVSGTRLAVIETNLLDELTNIVAQPQGERRGEAELDKS